MVELSVAGLDGTPRQVSRDTLASLVTGTEGSLLFPEDAGFADATLIWNGMITKRPAVVVQPRRVEDVVRAINFVRDNGLLLSIKGGGHNIAGLALSDGGVTLDMAGMRDVVVDAEARIARVGPVGAARSLLLDGAKLCRFGTEMLASEPAFLLAR